MQFKLRMLFLTVVALSGFAVACGDRLEPLGPVETPDAARAVSGLTTLGDVGVESTPIVRVSPLPKNITVRERIGPAGGSINIPAIGLKLSIPEGALTESVQITVTAAKGSAVLYDFQPHGLQFHRPVKIEQDLRVTNAYRNDTVMSVLRGAYFPQSLNEVVGKSKVRATEFFSVTFDLTKVWAKFFTTHFSGYMMVSG